MKRTMLKRRTSLTQKISLSKVSDKQKDELALRRLLKWKLFNEQEGRCANKKCGKIMTYYNEASDNYPHLSHKKPLSRGGKTDRDNCSVICAECHSKEHGLRNKYSEKPQWGQ